MSEKVEKLKKSLKKVKINGASFYVAEGDLLLSDDQLKDYAGGGQANVPPAERGTPHELLGILKDGKLVRWKVGLKLSYTIIKSTFSEANYSTVRDNMKQATVDWQKTCGIEFEHRKDLDAAGTTDGALFTVQGVDADGEFIAAAFFPDEPASRRQLVIDPSYFTTGFHKVGVLRHELGHVLGFRHEHIRPDAPAECPSEGTAGTFPFNKYDPQSVMHYFCGGVGDKNLKISDKDREAAQRLYGPSFDEIHYFD